MTGYEVLHHDGAQEDCPIRVAHDHRPELRHPVLPTMESGKTRRSAMMRADVPAYDPREDLHPDGGTMGTVAFFEYREDAVGAGAAWCAPQGWIVRPQYLARYDLWCLMARRKSWRGADIMVEACIGADKRVVRHAHVPDEWSYGRLVERREGAAGRPAKNRECPICGAAAFLDCNLAQHPAAVPA